MSSTPTPQPPGCPLLPSPQGCSLVRREPGADPPVPGWPAFAQVLAAVSAPVQQQQQHIAPRRHTSDRKGLREPPAALPLGLLLHPGKVAAPSAHRCRFPVVFACCPQPATAPALPSQPVEAVTATRLCSILAKPSICRQQHAARSALSQHGSRAELGRRGGGQHPGVSPGAGLASRPHQPEVLPGVSGLRTGWPPRAASFDPLLGSLFSFLSMLQPKKKVFYLH